jgi:hypothetical protein
VSYKFGAALFLDPSWDVSSNPKTSRNFPGVVKAFLEHANRVEVSLPDNRKAALSLAEAMVDEQFAIQLAEFLDLHD